jgi:hypothetical protein
MLPSFSYSDSSLRRCKVPGAGERVDLGAEQLSVLILNHLRSGSPAFSPSPQMLQYALRRHQQSFNLNRGLHVREYVRVDFDREAVS